LAAAPAEILFHACPGSILASASTRSSATFMAPSSSIAVITRWFTATAST